MVKRKEARVNSGSESEPSQAKTGGAVFLIAALDMSWRLAIAFLVPIIGGHYLDEALNTTPWITVAGFVVALVGVVGVMKYVVAESNRRVAELNHGGKGGK